MTDPEIDRIVREHGYVLPASVYISICRSSQVDHVKKTGISLTYGHEMAGIGKYKFIQIRKENKNVRRKEGNGRS